MERRRAWAFREEVPPFLEPLQAKDDAAAPIQVMKQQYAEADKGIMEAMFEESTAKGLERRRGIRNRVPKASVVARPSCGS